jgi:hypothetical protein
MFPVPPLPDDCYGKACSLHVSGGTETVEFGPTGEAALEARWTNRYSDSARVASERGEDLLGRVLATSSVRMFPVPPRPEAI